MLVATGRNFPWRVFIISGKDADLVESNLPLAEPCTQRYGMDQAGQSGLGLVNANNIFGVDFKSGLNTATYKYYIDFASDNKIEYVILDEGWTKSTTEILENNPNIDVKELIEYGRQKNVGIILWVLWKPLNANMKQILETYSGWVAKGVKVDFMQRNDQYMVESYEQIAAECARLNLLVDYTDHSNLRASVVNTPTCSARRESRATKTTNGAPTLRLNTIYFAFYPHGGRAYGLHSRSNAQRPSR